MFGMLAFPRDFEPEDHGWIIVEPVVPHQRLQAAMQELHRFGFVSTHWQRWEAPYVSPAGLVRVGYDKERDCFYGMYMPPFERDRNSFTLPEFHREMRLGVGGGVLSLGRPSVSLTTVSPG